MIKAILYRVKKLLDITDSQEDSKLLLFIENALWQVRAYIHTEDVSGLEAPIAQYAAYLYTSGMEAAISSSSSSSSSEGGGVTPVMGELKSEHYPGGISWEYTTSADFAEKSYSGSGSSSGGDPATYFTTFIAPLLRSRRKIMTLAHPFVEKSPERY